MEKWTYDQFMEQLEKLTLHDDKIALSRKYAEYEEEQSKLAVEEALPNNENRPILPPFRQPKARGGKRPNAGRPRLDDDIQVVQQSLRIDLRDKDSWLSLKKQYNRCDRELFTHAINLLTDYARYVARHGHPKDGMLPMRLTQKMF